MIPPYIKLSPHEIWCCLSPWVIYNQLPWLKMNKSLSTMQLKMDKKVQKMKRWKSKVLKDYRHWFVTLEEIRKKIYACDDTGLMIETQYQLCAVSYSWCSLGYPASYMCIVCTIQLLHLCPNAVSIAATSLPCVFCVVGTFKILECLTPIDLTVFIALISWLVVLNPTVAARKSNDIIPFGWKRITNWAHIAKQYARCFHHCYLNYLVYVTP